MSAVKLRLNWGSGLTRREALKKSIYVCRVMLYRQSKSVDPNRRPPRTRRGTGPLEEENEDPIEALKDELLRLVAKGFSQWKT